MEGEVEPPNQFRLVCVSYKIPNHHSRPAKLSDLIGRLGYPMEPSDLIVSGFMGKNISH